MNKYIWSFVILVALADITFTWACRNTAAQWESNPAAMEIVSNMGPGAAIAYRLAWLAFAGVMARTRTRFSWLVAPTWAAGHAYLLCVLVQSLPDAIFLGTAGN
jgi:hypothetical protein